ncbi:hypothetical protein BH23BAC4_BH23BAC4_00870 [soil metagenome]
MVFNRQRKSRLLVLLIAGLAVLPVVEEVVAQDQAVAVHRRGNLWESVWNYGMIGDLGAWDYLTPRPLGLFPGFVGFTHPTGGEFNAVNTYANANMHNFRSGIWIGARNLNVPGVPPDFRPTPKPYEVYLANVQQGIYGMPSQLPPVQLHRNYIESPDFNPLLPEEWAEATWDTNIGITVTLRTYVWGFPGFNDFIIYDYQFENTGRMVSTLVGEVVSNTDQFVQTLNGVYFALHSGISVSTKSQINFHSDLNAVQAGAFGWQPGTYHDFYHLSSDRTLAFSYNYNGGAAPTPWDPYPIKDGEAWRQRFGPELQSPAAFGWLALHADPAQGSNPNSPAPDVLRIDSHKGGTFQGRDLDFEFFTRAARGEQGIYEFMTTPGMQEQLGNTGNRFNFYTLSYGPYTIPHGSTVRIVLAEIAGVMDYQAVALGDPDGLFPDATIAAIQENAARARQAVSWGRGATVDGIPLAADVPEPPPAPDTDAVNASEGTEVAAIAVTWDNVAELATFTDGSGGIFYDGPQDFDGYRIYRSQDFQFTSDTEAPAFRGAYWTLIEDIPAGEVSQYFDMELDRYRFVDNDVEFGRRYGYYVAAYNNNPRPWTSANGTLVTDLPELVSGSYNRSEPANAVAGPVDSFDVYAIPNPYVYGDPQRSFGLNDPYRVEFRNLPERATIRIYTVSGDLIRTLRHGPDSRGNLSGTIAWDQKSESGLIVAPGLYIFHVSSDTEGLVGRLTGRVMLIR